MSTATKTTGILASLQWVPTQQTVHLDTDVGEAIDSYCKDAGIECPADDQWQDVEWAVPAGTELLDEAMLEFQRDRRLPAPALRVTLGSTVFALIVGWSDMCGCGTCAGLPSLRVVEVRHA